MSNHQDKTAYSKIYGQARLLTSEEELEVVETIQKGKKFLGLNDEELSKADRKLKRASSKAVHRLVEAYSPLIEKIAKEHYNSSDSPSVSYDDFLSEAMIVATQCARNFNPHKGRKIIRFSSYVSRPVSSSLLRVSLKAKTPLSTPNDKIADSRKWSHTFFDLANQGINVTDEVVSQISGVNMTQGEVSGILDSQHDQSIDDITPPGVIDKINLISDDDQRENIIHAFHCVFGEKSIPLLTAMGVIGDVAIFSPFILSTTISIPRKEAQSVLMDVPTLMSHPLTRFRIQSALYKNKE